MVNNTKNSADKLVKVIQCVLLFVSEMVYTYLVIKILQYFGFNLKNDTTFILATFFISISFMGILFLLFKKTLTPDYHDFKTNWKTYLKENFKYWIAGLVLMYICNGVLLHVYQNSAANEALVQDYLNDYPVFMLFSTILYAPFAEELIYRRSVRNVFENNFLYVLASGVLFGLVHILANSSQPLYFLPYGVVGAMFALMYVKTKNIWVPMTFHFIHNTMVIILSLTSILR